MRLKSLGGSVIALGILLLLLGLAQPATVADSSTACVDSSAFSQECSTVSYERPNVLRSQLIGAGIFLFVSGSIMYGVSSQREQTQSISKTQRRPSPHTSNRESTERETQPRESNSQTLREQLEAKQQVREGVTDTESNDTDSSVGQSEYRGPAPVGNSTNTTETANEAKKKSVEPVSISGKKSVQAFLVGSLLVSGAGLIGAFLITGILGFAVTIQSGFLRVVVFVCSSLPGIGLVYLYRRRKPEINRTNTWEEKS